jgi:hypothetical protein
MFKKLIIVAARASVAVLTFATLTPRLRIGKDLLHAADYPP